MVRAGSESVYRCSSLWSSRSGRRPSRREHRRFHRDRSSTPTGIRRIISKLRCSTRTNPAHLADLMHGRASRGALALARLGHSRRTPLGVEQAPKVPESEAGLLFRSPALTSIVEDDGDLHGREVAVAHRPRGVVRKVERGDLAVRGTGACLPKDLLDEVHLANDLQCDAVISIGTSLTLRDSDSRCGRQCIQST